MHKSLQKTGAVLGHAGTTPTKKKLEHNYSFERHPNLEDVT